MINIHQVPVEIPWSTNTDGSGNATHTEYLGKDGWYNLAISGQTTNNSSWSFSRNLSFLRPAFGSQIHVPVGISAPGSRLDISIVNGPRNAVVSGLIYGQKAIRPHYLTDIGGLDDYSANTVNTFQSRQKLFPDGVPTPTSALTPSFVCPANTTVSKTFTLPLGTVAIRILATASGLLFKYNLLVLGHQTVEQYYGNPTAPGATIAVPIPTLPFTIAIENDWDMQLDFTVDGDPTNQINFFVSALSSPEPPGQAGAAQSVTTPVPVAWQAGTASAKFAVVVNAGATSSIVASIAGTRVFCHFLWGEIDTTPVGSSATLEDTGGLFLGFFAGSTKGPWLVDLNSVPTTVGQGVQWHNTSAVATGGLNGALVYSLG